MKKIAIYSAIYGNFDEIKEQPEQTVHCDFIMFTDNEELRDYKGKWDIRFEQREESHPRMKAKFFKCNPHIVLKDYDVVIWIDGSVQIKTNEFVKFCLDNISNQDIAVLKHPERDCIYDEADFCKDWPKYQDENIEGQVNEYKKDGYPRHNGLSACTVIIRNNENAKIKEFNEAWWAENLKWTYQDQLSFEYLLWKQKLPINKIELDLWNNPYFEVQAYKHNTNL